MFFAPRLPAIAATVLLLSACSSNRDRATLSLSLGSTIEALSLEGVDVTRFTLTVTCVDGTVTTVRGDLGADGAFTADVPRCPAAKVSFQGFLADGHAALAGSTQTIIRPPTTDVVVPVLRVGTVTVVNDGSTAALCAVADAQAPDFDGRFSLEPGATSDLVLPTTGVSLTCVPASTCTSLAACTFSDPTATLRAVSVPFAGAATVNLAAPVPPQLLFTIGPPTPLMAGQTSGVFEVTLVDEHGVTMPRSDVTVTLVAESSTVHGGFSGGSIQLASGVGRFLGVSFTTAGTLTFHASALVDGAVINSASRDVTVLPGVVATLGLTAPGTLNYVVGQAIDVTVSALDPYGNVDNLYTGTVSLAATPITEFSYAGPHQFTAADAGVYTFANTFLYLIGSFAISATDDLSHTSLPLAVNIVQSGTLDHFEVLPSVTSVQAGAQFTVNVNALDPAGNLVTSFAGQVDLTSTGTGATPVLLTAGQGSTPYSIGLLGTYQVHATYGLAVGASVPITVTAGAPQSLALLSGIPSPAFVSTPFGFTMQVQDSLGNPCDPSAFTFTPTLNDAGTGALLISLGYVTYVGDVVHLDYFSVDRAASGLSLQVATTPALPAGDGVSNVFDVTAPSCPVAYAMIGAATGTGCDPALPVGTIGQALAVVDAGGEVRLATGTFLESVVLSKPVTIQGNYDTLFSGQSVATPTTIKGSSDAVPSVRVTGGAFASIANVLIAAPSYTDIPIVTAIAVDTGATLHLEKSKLIGLVTDSPVEGRLVQVADAAEVLLRNNWINLGDAVTAGSASTRHGIYDTGTGAVTVTVVQNTFYVPAASLAEVLYVQSSGQYSFTDNLVVGNFASCAGAAGTCALRDGPLGLASAQANYFLEIGAAPQTLYVSGAGALMDVNQHGGAEFYGNVNNVVSDLSSFPAFKGPDSNVATMDDNDWHLPSRPPFDIGIDATQSKCGVGLRHPCGGDGYDIDGQLRMTPTSCAGADENGGPAS